MIYEDMSCSESHFTVSFEKNYHQIHAETKTKTPSRQTAKIKARFDFCIDYIYYIFDFCNIF